MDAQPHYKSPRVEPSAFLSLQLRAHELLADVPLHDVWRFRLAGNGSTPTMEDVIDWFIEQEPKETSKVTRLLFAIRETAGRWFGWDRDDQSSTGASYTRRLSDTDRSRSLDQPGSSRGFWKTVYTFEREAVGEVINGTVHAFLVFALEPEGTDHLLYWGIYVKPVNRFTRYYMALIDPFRRNFIYPTLIRRFETSWRKRPQTLNASPRV